MAIPSSAAHHTIHISVGDQQADVDKKIAPLVKAMWQAGITTTQSCQDSPPGWVWLEFPTTYDLERFLNAVGVYEDTVGSLHDRMLHGYDRLGRPRVGQWVYAAIVHDLAVNIIDDKGAEREEYTGTPDFAIFISVNFPQADLSRVRKRIRGFNRKRAHGGKVADRQQQL
jgi:hypothetical protein